VSKPMGSSINTGISRSAYGNASTKSILFEDRPWIFAIARIRQTLVQFTTGA
jgi:hypothetical protein